jgi:hypothetical protein
MAHTDSPAATYPHPDECYYCGTLTPGAECAQRGGEQPCTPRRLLRGTNAEVRAAVAAFHLSLRA